MARWDPDGRGRLEQAAMALYAERGFENTTVAAIAERAGLTERTFFRHYADKREVLFGGSGELQDLLVRAVADAPASLSPLEAAASGIETIAARLEERRPFSQQRQAIIASSAELRERELIKLSALSAAVADTLRGRGAGEPAASLAADAAIAVFRTAFERWVDERNDRPFTDLVRETFDELKAVAAG